MLHATKPVISSHHSRTSSEPKPDSRSTQRLTEWLKANESGEQQAARQQNDREILAAVEREKVQLKKDVERNERIVADKTAEITRLTDQLAKLTQERLDDQKKLSTATDNLPNELKTRNKTDAKAMSLETPNKQPATDTKGIADIDQKTGNIRMPNESMTKSTMERINDSEKSNGASDVVSQVLLSIASSAPTAISNTGQMNDEQRNAVEKLLAMSENKRRINDVIVIPLLNSFWKPPVPGKDRDPIDKSSEALISKLLMSLNEEVSSSKDVQSILLKVMREPRRRPDTTVSKPNVAGDHSYTQALHEYNSQLFLYSLGNPRDRGLEMPVRHKGFGAVAYLTTVKGEQTSFTESTLPAFAKHFREAEFLVTPVIETVCALNASDSRSLCNCIVECKKRKEAIAIFQNLFNHGQSTPTLRASIIEVIGTLGEITWIPLIQKASANNAPDMIVVAAAKALSEIGSGESVSHLLLLAPGRTAQVQIAIADAIQKMPLSDSFSGVKETIRSEISAFSTITSTGEIRTAFEKAAAAFGPSE